MVPSPAFPLSCGVLVMLWPDKTVCISSCWENKYYLVLSYISLDRLIRLMFWSCCAVQPANVTKHEYLTTYNETYKTHVMVLRFQPIRKHHHVIY